MALRRRVKPRTEVLTASQLLAEFPAPVQALMHNLRKVVVRAVPTAAEHVYPGWRAIGFRDAQAGYFCGLFPRRDGVRIVFERGAELDDPDALFSAGEHLRQVRTIDLGLGDHLRLDALVAMLRRAVLHGSTR